MAHPAHAAAEERLARNLGLGAGWYALYPPPRAFHDFSDDRFIAAIRHSNGDPIPPRLALHFEAPPAYRSGFGRPRGTMQDGAHVRADAYCDRLVREVGLVGSLFDRDRDVVQVSLAPGLAPWLHSGQVADLLESLGRHFHVGRQRGIDLAMTLELDGLALQPVAEWAALGFNRVGINLAALAGADTPAPVQRDRVTDLLAQAREAGFANLRVEVPYGLPGQSDAGFAELLAAVVAAGPERIGLRHCPGADADAGHERHARMLLAGADALEAAGYLHLGVDLFAHPDDPLVAAQQRGLLYRDALGFGGHGATHLVGFGVGAISQLGGCYAQNPQAQAHWDASIDRGCRAADRGVELDEEDHLRAAILQDILCRGRIAVAKLELQYAIDFSEAFAGALARLRPLFEDGSLRREAGTIVLDRLARLSAQAIATQFDPSAAPAAALPA